MRHTMTVVINGIPLETAPVISKQEVKVEEIKMDKMDKKSTKGENK